MGSNGLLGLGLPRINPPQPAEDNLPAGIPRGARAAQILATEQLAELRALNQTMSALTARLAGNIFNETLATATAQFDSTGTINLQYHVAAGSIRLRNLSAANVVTVVAGGAAASGVPVAGPGVWRVPAATVDVIGMLARQITLYGTAGDYVSYSVYTTGNAPNGS